MSDVLLGVIGNPILHSQSPILFREFFREAALPGIYLRLAVRSAEEGLQVARALELQGMNVTSPFKEEMSELLGLGSSGINTVKIDGDSASGISTDPHGAVAPLGDIQGKHVLVIGAGGAAQAAIRGIIAAGGVVTVTNRTAERGERIAKALDCRFRIPEALRRFDVIVNTVPALIVPPEVIAPTTVALDAIYHYETPFSEMARARGARVISGREWLLHQGLEAFSFFTGKRISPAGIQPFTTPDRRSLIYLMGMMGSGKSTVGPELAASLGWEFIELDREIELRAGRSIPEIFQAEGESHFRNLEREELSRVASRSRCVISLGGGAVVGNEHLLPAEAVKVWLFSPLSELQARVSSRGDRPLVAGQNISERLEALWRERRLLYAQLSDLVVPTYGWSREEVSRRICDEIRKTGLD